jgi:hypothetical protein
VKRLLEVLTGEMSGAANIAKTAGILSDKLFSGLFCQKLGPADEAALRRTLFYFKAGRRPQFLISLFRPAPIRPAEPESN